MAEPAAIDPELVTAQIVRLRDAAKTLGVSDRFAESLIRYAVRGVPTGGFLRAFLANDLAQAISRADDDALREFRPLLHFVWNFLGAKCWGSYAMVDEWLAAPMTAQKVACHG
jgi:hypothetical protein